MASSIEIFLSYAHRDEKLREELEKHLSNLKRQGFITAWHDRKIIAGQEWRDEIDTHLNTSQIILLLISPDFMASDYCHGIEVKRALERHERGEAQVIPVILRPVHWEGALFGKLQTLPKDAKAITLWRNRDEAFLDVVVGITNTIKYILEHSFFDTLLEVKEEETLAIAQSRSSILENPFDISRPVRGKMLYGRSLELEIMQSELCDSKYGQALLVYGQRRSGKSSLCLNFLDRQVKLPFWRVFFSLQNASKQNEETILMQLSEAVNKQFSTQFQHFVPDWNEYNDPDPQVRFRRLLQNCIGQASNMRLVLALDEFGGAIDSYEKHILEYRFFTYWKDLISEIPQLSLIFVMPTSTHEQIIRKSFGNVFSFADSLQVTFLDRESAERLLANPLKEQNINIEPNAAALATTLAGGNPYYMTLIGQKLIQYLNKNTHQQIITDSDLRKITYNLIKEDSNMNFVFLKKELWNKEELCILEAIVEYTNIINRKPIQLSEVARRIGLSRYSTRQHLDRLCNGMILQKHDTTFNPHYSFVIELISLWLRSNRWFFAEPK